MTEIIFEEPPARESGPGMGRAGTGKYAEIAQRLKVRPGEWAIVATFDRRNTAHMLAYRIKRGVQYAFRPAGAFEATSRTMDGEHRTYARYVGEQSSGE